MFVSLVFVIQQVATIVGVNGLFCFILIMSRITISRIIYNRLNIVFFFYFITFRFYRQESKINEGFFLLLPESKQEGP